MADSSSDDDIPMLYMALRALKKKRKRQYWVHPYNQIRAAYGEFQTGFLTLRPFKDRFFGYYRMTPDKFDHLLTLITPKLEPVGCNFREPVQVDLKLAVTLR